MLAVFDLISLESTSKRTAWSYAMLRHTQQSMIVPPLFSVSECYLPTLSSPHQFHRCSMPLGAVEFITHSSVPIPFGVSEHCLLYHLLISSRLEHCLHNNIGPSPCARGIPHSRNTFDEFQSTLLSCIISSLRLLVVGLHQKQQSCRVPVRNRLSKPVDTITRRLTLPLRAMPLDVLVKIAGKSWSERTYVSVATT